MNVREFSEDMSILNTHEKDIRMTTHVLQLFFLGYDGFRFPIAYFPTSGITAPDLYMNVWEVVGKLHG